MDQRDPDDDPDADGRTNFVERALGGDPAGPDSEVGMEIATEPQLDGSVVFTVTYLKAAPELLYDVVHSTDLTGWSNTGVSPEQFDGDTGLYSRTWSAPAGAPAAFVRLVIG